MIAGRPRGRTSAFRMIAPWFACDEGHRFHYEKVESGECASTLSENFSNFANRSVITGVIKVSYRSAATASPQLLPTLAS